MKLMMKLSVCLALMCITVGATVLIVGPKFIRENVDYTIAISNILDETSNDCLLNVRLEGLNGFDHSVLLTLSQTVKIMADTNMNVTFKTPHYLPLANYKIIIEGKQPSTSYTDNIYREVEVKYDGFFLETRGLIQLNKPVITPGEILRFRVIVLNTDGKPVVSHEKSVSVYVKDPNGNVIKQWSNVSLYSGVFENQIAIPTIPVLGTYSVRVAITLNDVPLASKEFEVRNYDIDSIDFNIYPTAVPLLQYQALNLTIDVKNYIGKPVRGTFTISSVKQYYRDITMAKVHTWDVNGKRKIDVPFSEKLEIRSDEDTTTLIIRCFFTEQYTNRTTIKEEKIVVYASKYKVIKANNRLTYLPGSSFTARLKVTYHNDEPAKFVTLLVAVEGVDETYQQNCTSNMKGEITFSMPINNSTHLNNIKVYDGDRQIRGWGIEEVDSDGLHADKYIKVELLTRVKFNRMFWLLVTCSENMTFLLYYVIAQGNIVDAGFFRPNQMNIYPFKLLMSEKLIPRSKIFVATIVRKSFIYGDVELSINDFGNPLEIKIEENISEDGVDPGDEIELGIRGRPGAYVSLAAYDQRLMQQIVEHRGNHDIVFAEVWQMFDNYFDRSRYSYDKLTDLGIFAVVTDDTIRITSEPSVYNVWHSARGIYPDARRFGMPGPYRTDFSESWLWQNLTIPPSGRAELVVTVPHSTTSWFITGITIDPKYGLGIVKKPITFSTVKIFFILDHLPHTIKRGETVSLHFTLFSSMQEVFGATVTMYNTKNEIKFIDRPAEDTNDTKSVFVPPNSDAPVSFLVKAMKLGELEIRVNASIMQGVISDSFKKIVMVHPEDVTILRSKRIQFDRDSPSNQSFDIPLLMDNKAEDRDVPVQLIVYPDQQSLKDLQNNYNVSVYHDRFEELMRVNSDFHENITINSIPLIWDLYHLNGKIARKLSVIVMSSGSGTIQIYWQYRLNLIYFKPRFNLQITKLPTPTKWMKELHICCSFIPKKRDNHSNGTVVEVSIPIGYAMDSHNVVEETTINPMSRIEILHDGTTVLVYFNHMGNEATCFSVFAYRRYKNRVRHPSYIKVQDSYRPELNMVKMFDFH